MITNTRDYIKVDNKFYKYRGGIWKLYHFIKTPKMIIDKSMLIRERGNIIAFNNGYYYSAKQKKIIKYGKNDYVICNTDSKYYKMNYELGRYWKKIIHDLNKIIGKENTNNIINIIHHILIGKKDLVIINNSIFIYKLLICIFERHYSTINFSYNSIIVNGMDDSFFNITNMYTINEIRDIYKFYRKNKKTLIVYNDSEKYSFIHN